MSKEAMKAEKIDEKTLTAIAEELLEKYAAVFEELAK